MDPASFAFAVVGMFKTCVEGYAIVSDAYNAPRDAQNAARRIRIEGALLRTWGEHFDVLGQTSTRSEKLKGYISRGHTFNGVFEALCAISEEFVDVRGMSAKYGIVFEYRKGQKNLDIPRDVDRLLRNRSPSPSPRHSHGKETQASVTNRVEDYKIKMSLLAKCQWSLMGKSRVGGLVSELREYNDDLIRLCSWEAQSQINRGLPTVALGPVNDYAALHMLANIVEDTAEENTSSPSAEGRQRTAALARFKARLKTPRSVSGKFAGGVQQLDIRDFEIIEGKGAGNLAILSDSIELVYIEWRSYSLDDIFSDNRNMKLHSDEKSVLVNLVKEQIQSLGDFLYTRDRPPDFRTLQCLGLFKDARETRYGICYSILPHLRQLPRPFPTEGVTERLPSSLTDVFNRVPTPDLGQRFDLARKLMASIVVIHTCGWLHKSISSDNVLFFPAKLSSQSGRIQNQKKDFGRPYLMGYGISRPDDVAEQATNEREAKTSSGMKQHLSARPAGVDLYLHPAKAAKPSRRFRHATMYILSVSFFSR